MDVYSSGEELLVKARKPYTITKQRERWTEEEHTKFLEALKLHGRAWQRIEEHIGTKTAVQIRSHAQKFFSKLEKEALVKGVPIGQAIDIEIPPPRPKRKPNNPYPRKTGSVCSPNTQVRAKDENHIHYAKQVVDLEKESQSEEHVGDDGEKNLKGTCVGDECSGSFTLFQEMPSVVGPKESSATATGVARKLSNLKEFVPVKKTSNTDERSESHAGEGLNLIHRPNKPDPVEKAQNDSKNEMHAAKSFPRHAPVQILDGSQGTCSQGFSSDVSFQEPRVQMKIPSHPALYSNPATSGIVGSHISTTRSSNQPIYPGFHPLPSPFPNNHEDYSSYLHMSSTFSSLILSALLQNPAAHAAASFAASLWPSTNVETSANSSAGNNGGFPGRAVHPAPSMAAIAAATVAAATAWWAAHGLLPLSAPLPTGFPIPPGSVAAPFANVGQTSAANDEKEGNNSQVPGSEVQQPEQVPSEALRPQHSASKSSATSSSDSGNSGDKMDIGVSPTNEVAPSISDQKDISKVKNKKQADRSSCGSNTPSGSDVETDALEKNVEGNEETKEPDENNNSSELNGRRMRIVGNNLNDSWKEVSEEGRLAFRALFSRGRLPQSFSPPQDVTCKELDMNCGAEDQRQIVGQSNEALRLDLNSNTWESVSCDQGVGNFGSQCQGNVNSKDGLLTIGLLQTKLTSNRTGFKPYKRCSVEATDNRMMNSSNQEQGSCSKRLRLEGEASI